MTTSSKSGAGVIGISSVVGIGVVLALILSGLFLATPMNPATPASHLTLASGSTQQWAFGGNVSSSYSCSGSTCFGGNITTVSSLSLSYNYAIGWVVIYTVTNVSSSQTEVEAQAALSASLMFSLSECIVETMGSPCTTISASVNLAGNEMAVGFTNLTSGTVYLNAGGTPGNVPATAISNSASTESFNFSGSYNVQGIPTNGTGPASGSANFDIGGSETSSVLFSTPLGVVPINPAPGDSWNSSAPFSASGHYSSGYSLTATVGGKTQSVGNWLSGSLANSGTLWLNGTDLGAYTLWDNYTNPPTSATAQLILLDFGSGAYSASDGWVIVPSDLFLGIANTTLVHPESPPVVGGTHPSAGGISSITSGESAYYQKGVGFIGASVTGNTSIPIAPTGVGAPSVKLSAGPEPVSVAEQQYNGILSGATGGSSSSLPWTWLILAVVVVVVVIAVGAIAWMRSSRRRRPPVAAYPGGVATSPPLGPGPTPPPAYPASPPPGPR